MVEWVGREMSLFGERLAATEECLAELKERLEKLDSPSKHQTQSFFRFPLFSPNLNDFTAFILYHSEKLTHLLSTVVEKLYKINSIAPESTRLLLHHIGAPTPSLTSGEDSFLQPLTT